MSFDGFRSDETFFPLPESFIMQALPALDDLSTLKAALYALWRLTTQEGNTPSLPEASFLQPEALAASGLDAAAMRDGLQKAVQAKILLIIENGSERIYLINSPRGRMLLNAYQNGEWQPDENAREQPAVRPNIYRLYEENIGPLTPLMADILREAEKEYPAEWIARAVSEAVKRNIRNWKYVEAILKRWKEEGYAHPQNRRDPEETRFRYLKSKFSEYIES